MAFVLKFSSVDDGEEQKTFASKDEAIAFAKAWFLEGYNDDAIDDTSRKAAADEADLLVEALHSGRRFHCGMFHESVEIAERG